MSGEWTATGIAGDVAAGRRSPVDVVDEALGRIAARDRGLNAFAVVRAEAAPREAAAIDAAAGLPLAGVPIAIKENIPVAGEPMRCGSAATSDAPQPADHPVVVRLRAAGAVVVGLTRMPELGVYGATDSVYGVTRNPWNSELTPGGSSGGSAAAVAAAEVPVAHANDGLGSIRIPAACTGLFGLKPGLGVVPAQIGTTDWYAMAENGPLATTVADAAVMLAVMADRPALASVEVLDGRIRVAVSMRSPVVGTRLDPQWREAADDVARILSRAGHDVRRADPSYPNGAAVAGLARWFAGTAGDAAALDAGRLEPRVRTHARIGRVVRATPLMADRLRAKWRAVAAQFLANYDVLVTPALAQPPIAARDWGRGSWRATMLANVAYAPFAGAWNLAGFPAASVPMGVHPVSGTPVAAQLVAAPGREDLLLATAALIERERPWQRVAPNYA